MDVIGAVVLSVLAVASTAALVLASPLARRPAARLLAIAAAWLAAVTVIAATGVFVRVGPAAVPRARAPGRRSRRTARRCGDTWSPRQSPTGRR